MKKEEFVALGISEELAKKAADASAEELKGFVPKTRFEKIEEIKLVNRAKLLLMEKEGLDENGAHRFLEKLAMNSRSTKRKIAEEIIAKYKE